MSSSASNSRLPHQLIISMESLASAHRKSGFPSTMGSTKAKSSRDALLREKRRLFDQSLAALLQHHGVSATELSIALDRAWHAAFDQMTAKRHLPFPLQGHITREMSLEYYKLKTMWSEYVDSAHEIARELAEKAGAKAG